MSNRLVKPFATALEIPNDDVVGIVTITKSGKVNVQAPQLPAFVLIKFLQNAIIDILYASFEPRSQIVPPTE